MLLEEKLKEGCIIKIFYDEATGEFVTRATDDARMENRSVGLLDSVSAFIKTYDLERVLEAKENAKKSKWEYLGKIEE